MIRADTTVNRISDGLVFLRQGRTRFMVAPLQFNPRPYVFFRALGLDAR